MTTIGEKREFVYEWRIKDFLSLSCPFREFYESPLFQFGGASWNLKIYPKRRLNPTPLYLQRNSSGPPIIVDVTLGIKNAEGKITCESMYTHIFTKDERKGRALSTKSELLARKYELMPSGDFTVVCKIQHSKSAEVTMQQFLNENYKEISTQTEVETGKACASGTFPHDDKILQDLKELFLKGEDCDVTINVQGQEFAAHKAMLKARSPVLAVACRHNTKKNLPGPLEVKDCDPSCFSDFLNFLYSGDISVISGANVFKLFTVADKYEVLDLRSKCLEFIKNSLSVDTFCESLSLALHHSDNELIMLCTEFFITNAPKIIVTLKWQTFAAKHPTTSNELFVKLLVPGNSSEA